MGACGAKEEKPASQVKPPAHEKYGAEGNNNSNNNTTNGSEKKKKKETKARDTGVEDSPDKKKKQGLGPSKKGGGLGPSKSSPESSPLGGSQKKRDKTADTPTTTSLNRSGKQRHGASPRRQRQEDPDGWPWKWLTMPQPGADAKAETYSTYLKAFKILDKVEVEAYTAWKQGDEKTARALLDERLHGKQSPPLSPLQTKLDELCGTLGEGEVGALVRNDSFNKLQRRDVVMNVRHTDKNGGGERPVKKYPKSDVEMHVLMASLKTCPLFAHLVRDSEVESVAAAMRKLTFAAGEAIHIKGMPPEPEREGLMIVTKGRVDNQDANTSLMTGSYFGEDLVAALGQKCGGTAIAGTQSVEVFVLENFAFGSIMTAQARHKRETYGRWLSDIPLLRSLPKSQLATLADALLEKKYAQGEKIIAFGARPNHIHIIVEGEVGVVGREQSAEGELLPDRPRDVCSFTVGHPIGYIEFFDHNPSNNIADVVAKSSHVITAQIDKGHFEQCMGPIHDLLDQLTEAPEYAYYRSVKAANQKKAE